MKKYEGLFILNITNREESIKETIDKVSEEIAAAGGRVQTVQKMDKRAFTRVAHRRYTAGFFVNVIFECPPEALQTLRGKFSMSEDVFRVMFTLVPHGKEFAQAA